MTFAKFIASESEPLSGIFASDYGALFAINGRLSGFYPTPASGGDPGTPGICTTTLIDGTIQRYISVSLAVPAEPDDERFYIGKQTNSFAIIDGTVVGTDKKITIDMVLHEPTGVLLTDLTPIIIYMNLPNTVEDPTFGVERESVIDLGPQKKAKLAFYDPETQTWQPYPAVSLRGIWRRLLSLSNRLGGFLVTRYTSTQVQVSPGFITGQFGRIINPSISVVPVLANTGSGFRKDVVFVNDPGAENLPITFTILKGRREVALQVNARKEPPPHATSPRMVALSEVIMGTGGPVETIDIRPVQAWATDAMQQRDPDATNAINVPTLQPGVVLADTLPGADPKWAFFVFRGKSPSGLVLADPKSKFAVGLVGAEIQRTFTAPESGSLSFLPTSAQFPIVPYTLESSFRVVSVTAGNLDVTNDPAYAVHFDFMNGRFVGDGTLPGSGKGITARVFGEQFQVTFRQLRVLFSISENGDVSIPELEMIRQHIAANSTVDGYPNPHFDAPPNSPLAIEAQRIKNLPFNFYPPNFTSPRPENPSAHTGSNIVFENATVLAPFGLDPVPVPPVVSVQKAIELLADFKRPPPPSSTGKILVMSWRTPIPFPTLMAFLGPSPRDPNIPDDFLQAEGFYSFGIMGPSGGRSQYEGEDITDIPTVIAETVPGIKFNLPSGRLLGGTFSLVGGRGSFSTINSAIGNDANFSIWINSQRFDAQPARFHHSGNGNGGTFATSPPIRVYGTFTVDSKPAVRRGQNIRIGMFGPSVGLGAAAFSHAALLVKSFSADIFLEID